MNITIASYEEATRLLRSPGTTGVSIWPWHHVVSINDPGRSPPDGVAAHPSSLVLSFHDITADMDGKRMPTLEHTLRLVHFARGMSSSSRVLVHCGQGIARSSAAALTILASREVPSHDAAQRVTCELLRLKRFIMPNQLMVHHADEALGWGGKLFAAYRLRFKAGTGIWVPPEV